MSTSTQRRGFVIASAFLVVLASAFTEASAPASAHTNDATSTHAMAQKRAKVSRTRIGDPSWRPVDFNVFSAPVGTASTGYAEFGETILGLLPLHDPHPQLFVGPGPPHGPPYQREMSEAVASAGYDVDGPFTSAQFSEGYGVFATWMVIPGGGSPRGSSPDFGRDRIIPNSLFPLRVTGFSTPDGERFATNLVDFSVPPLDSPDLTPSFDVDGHSHLQVFITDNHDFGPPETAIVGDTSTNITMLDAHGDGWFILVSFSVV